ncbi:MAG TPA: rRNA maturation RNase YbeY [Thermodesulfobacteriota bacterium]|nr:rRNA maturation RNase YbeY [Thermodesulfobacteriota bacterium]
MKTAAKVGLLVEPKIKIEKKKVRHAAEAILNELGPVKKELSIFLTGDSTIKGLNKKYRHIDRPTDVLSFPMDDPRLLGDVVISVEMAKKQAKGLKVGFYQELTRLLVHGTLHLLGYDHAKGGKEARRMREKEEEIIEGARKKGVF